MLTSEDAVHGSFCCACYGVLLLIEGLLVQQALALGNADAGNCITHHVQGGDQHLDGAVDGQDQGVGQQGLVIDEAHTGQDGEEDNSPRAGSGRRAHRGQQGQQGDDHQLHGREVVARAARDEDRGDHLHDGGSIHVDGEGTLLTTEECLLSPGRNPSLTRAEIEEKLRQYLSVEKIIWLPFGIYNDETNGHIDNMCCFVKPGEVLLAWTDDENDPQYARSRAAFDLLSHTVDAKGRSFVIHKLPIPKHPICITEEDLLGYDFEAGEDQREAGERLAASYINFYLANHCVLLPRFGDENDTVAAEILGKCFPDRRILPIDARVILTGGGNIHCITQQIPAKKRGNRLCEI